MFLVSEFECIFIRIEPDWNVNDKWRDRPKNQYLIRIEPDWNVNYNLVSVVVKPFCNITT